MAKRLIYMGRVGDKYRIALFDEDNVLARSLPVKDVTVLPENVEYVNCTVKDGRVIPHLQGAKALCAVPKTAENCFKANDRHVTLNYKDFWLDKNKRPAYLYGLTEYVVGTRYASERGIDLDSSEKFFPSILLLGGTYFSVWDGICTEKTIYVIACLAVRKTSKRYAPTACVLAMTHTGKLFLMTRNEMGMCIRNGDLTFVQVGTPEISFPAVYYNSRAYTNRVPVVGLKDEETSRVIWQGRNEVPEEVEKKAEFFYWTKLFRTTVLDLRKYENARVFGISSLADAAIIIFPEKAEEIWLGLLQQCSSVRCVYLPPTVTKIWDYCVPKRRIKNITFYSNSPTVIDFCEKYEAQRVACDNPEEMLKQYYKSVDSQYSDIDEISTIAVLAGAKSEKQGISGTIWSAALFSLTSKGIATDKLHELYPVVDTCQGKYKKPTNIIKIETKAGSGSCMGTGIYGPERTRTLAAALTQFYPLCTRECEVSDKDLIYYEYQLGEYKLYVGENAFNPKRFRVMKAYEAEWNRYRSLSVSVQWTTPRPCRPDKKQIGEPSVLNHVVLLADLTGTIIHRFACNDYFKHVLWSLEGAAYTDEEPCGVLRYVDKIPVVSKWYGWGDNEKQLVTAAIFHSFLVFSFGSKVSKRQMVGIDLHTGALVTADYTTIASFRDVSWSTSANYLASWFSRLSTLQNIKLQPFDADLSHLFAKDCVYNLSKRGIAE